MTTFERRLPGLRQTLSARIEATVMDLGYAWRLWALRRTVTARTRAELDALSDRELADIGIPRCNIRRIARDAAYMEHPDG